MICYIDIFLKIQVPESLVCFIRGIPEGQNPDVIETIPYEPFQPFQPESAVYVPPETAHHAPSPSEDDEILRKRTLRLGEVDSDHEVPEPAPAASGMESGEAHLVWGDCGALRETGDGDVETTFQVAETGPGGDMQMDSTPQAGDGADGVGCNPGGGDMPMETIPQVVDGDGGHGAEGLDGDGVGCKSGDGVTADPPDAKGIAADSQTIKPGDGPDFDAMEHQDIS